MHSIPSPYNFVPLSDQVFFPDKETWADLVSMDIPFSDGICGKIGLNVKTITPIYIRDGKINSGQAETREKRTETKDFFHVSETNDYYIPGTSLKGMLRNIIEIVSFGKIAGCVDNMRYGFRDLTSYKYTNEITEKIDVKEYQSKAKAGWLYKEADKWFILPCEYARVEQEELEKYYKKNFSKEISIGKSRETAEKKYKVWGSNLNIQCQVDHVEKPYSHTCGTLHYKKVINLGSGVVAGKIVFTGQPMPREDGKKARKHMEFIFYTSAANPIALNQDVIDDFIFIHSDEKGEFLPEWKYWFPSIEKKPPVIPVFYLEDPKKRKLKSFGLAQMFRLPYKYSIHEAITHTSKEHLNTNRPDLTQLIFGYVTDKQALKGRVHIGHLKCSGLPIPESEITIIPGTPKPTYYPNYIEQNPNNNNRVIDGYTTFMDETVCIRGWKRYPVRDTVHTPPVDGDNKNITTIFKPLPAGTTFTGKIRIHNLRPQELGALIWALTWGGNKKLKHNLGMAKAYGFGQVEISITEFDLKDISGKKIVECEVLNAFTDLMQRKIKNWASSTQIKELIAMANPQYSKSHTLRYPVLRNKQRKNEFVEFKNKNMVLLPYSDYNESNFDPVISRKNDEKTDKKSYHPGKRHNEQQISSYKNGQRVQCIVLDEKTKKGGWKLRIIGGADKDTGTIHPQDIANTPADIEARKEYEMIIFSYSPGNCQFKWIKK